MTWLLTTFLDEDTRISRGDGGTVYVLVKDVSFEDMPPEASSDVEKELSIETDAPVIDDTPTTANDTPTAADDAPTVINGVMDDGSIIIEDTVDDVKSSVATDVEVIE